MLLLCMMENNRFLTEYDIKFYIIPIIIDYTAIHVPVTGVDSSQFRLVILGFKRNLLYFVIIFLYL